MIILAIIFFLIGSTSVKLFYNSTNAVAAVSVADTLNIMGESNPIYIILDEEIRQIAEEKSRAEAEAKRIAEEERLEKERIIAEEKAKAEEEKRRAAEEERRKNGKIAYLTFDDGPSKQITPLILDILQDYDIKATFFVIGKMANLNPDIIKRIHDEGHSIGHHSYSHRYSYIYKNTDNFLGELNSTEKVLKNILGEEFETRLLRLPGGSFEKYKHKFLEAAIEAGYKNYDWNSLNGDAEGIDLSKDRLINRLKATTKGKKEIIVLMHDIDSKKTTVDALPDIIDYLINEGYEFRVLD